MWRRGFLQGEIPYLDRWDNKGPLQYLLNAVGLAISEIWGMWAIQGLFLLGTVYFAFSTLRRAFGILPALCALAVFLALFAKFNPPGNFTEQYGLLFQFLTLYLFIRSEEQNQSTSSHAKFAFLHLGIGVLGAASFLLKPSLVALWIVIGIYWFFSRGYSLRKLAWAIAGGASILILFAGLFQALGALEALWDAVFVFNFALSDASLQERLGVVRYLNTVMFPISLLVIARLVHWHLPASANPAAKRQHRRTLGDLYNPTSFGNRRPLPLRLWIHALFPHRPSSLHSACSFPGLVRP